MGGRTETKPLWAEIKLLQIQGQSNYDKIRVLEKENEAIIFKIKSTIERIEEILTALDNG